MLWFSLGENCLTDDILRRHGKKSFSTPYSPCRSNIDYALMLEDCRYKDFLEPINLEIGDVLGKRCIRSKNIKDCSNIFDQAHMKGFEFTHHDPLNSDKDRESFIRKIERLNNARYLDDIVFFYYHRKNINSNFFSLKEKLKKFSGHYKGEKNSVLIVLFTQSLVQDVSERNLEIKLEDANILEFTFYTKNLWSGTNKDIFWGRVDDDLIGRMIEMVDLHLIHQDSAFEDKY